MWIFTRYGFYSIACASAMDGAPDPNTLMVRARRLDHLQKLQARFPEIAQLEIVTIAHRDYRYRLLVPKELWVQIIAELAGEQQWSNFKNEAARYQSAEGSDYTH